MSTNLTLRDAMRMIFVICCGVSDDMMMMCACEFSLMAPPPSSGKVKRRVGWFTIVSGQLVSELKYVFMAFLEVDILD